MLTDLLNTNEVKNAAGTEVEFETWDKSGRSHTWKQVTEPPNREHRMRVIHTTAGEGEDTVRRSNLSISKEITGVSGKKRKVIFSGTLTSPDGDIADQTELKNVIAEFMSVMATTGAATTVLFDCTGNGADALTYGRI